MFRNTLVFSGLVIGCLLFGQAVEDPAITELIETGSETIPASFPPISHDLNLPDKALLSLHTDLAFLPCSDQWPVAQIGDLSLSVEKLPWASDSGFIAHLSSQTDDVIVFAEQIEIELTAVSEEIAIFVNGMFVGAVPSEATAVAGLELGEVEMGLTFSAWSPATPPTTPDPEPPSQPALASLASARLHKGNELVADGTSLITRQQAFDKSIEKQLLRGRTLLLRDAVFVDWEAGDDSYDGLSAEPDATRKRGPKKSWRAAQLLVKAGGILVVHGNNGVYVDETPFSLMPPNAIIIPIGEFIVGPPADVVTLLSDGRWTLHSNGTVARPSSNPILHP